MEASHASTRAFLIDELKRDLVGPAAPDEELTDRPTIRYLTGILYPPRTAMEAEQDNESSEAPEGDDDVDLGTLMAAAFNPSAIGLSFAARNDTNLRAEIRCAVYEEHKEGPEGKRSIWKRRPLQIEPVTIRAADRGERQTPLAEGLVLFQRLRASAGHLHVTLSVVNVRRDAPADGLADAFSFFQPEIEVTAEQPGARVFLDRSKVMGARGDPEARLNALLYRHVPEFAVGHGCAVTWESAEGEDASLLRTQVIPEYEVPLLSAETDIPSASLEMDRIARAGDEESLRRLLLPLPATYRKWIDACRAALKRVSAEYVEVGTKNLAVCGEIATRIEAGVDLVCTDPMVRLAFRLANRVMNVQRTRTEDARDAAEGTASDRRAGSVHTWRAFQLAFILLCIPSIAYPACADRLSVDLLWFPTGGGKTEAYLGLTAFTIFLRRLRNEDKALAAGVSVLMRYTLRLLTIQQFQRAATMIMACEVIRKEDPKRFGEEPISLGLWVGSGATPNTVKEAREALRKLKDNEEVFEGNPYQLLACPWCGQKLTPHDYRAEGHLEIQCPKPGCEFDTGMPLWIVDEDVYHFRPSLLIATVDKFARLPWLEKSSSLFGLGKPTRIPPELIIQDELHLISGPLGTIVGLYETAIDALARRGSVGPKIIASTATIRGAAEQVRGLFDRRVVQFPPPAIDARDTFFAREIPVSTTPGRVFVGVHASGKSGKTAMLRIYALLLQRISEYRSEPFYRDPYWTLVGYFNSLRELGGARRLVDDDVRARIRGLVGGLGQPSPERELEAVRELTSRAASSEIPEILEQMAYTMEHGSALDVLLATNMISVGVDIDRLGLMVVNGQPKATAEYIQATSRIGRRYPGLVVTLYNASRPRDRSHYETFRTYHSALYRHVETSSVTPFSPRARDRALHAVAIAMIRHLLPEMSPEEAAGLFRRDGEGTKKVVETIMQRVRSVDASEEKEVRAQLDEVLERWRLFARAEALRYGRDLRNPDAPHLMEPIESGAEGFAGFLTLNSMRDVEPETELRILPEVGPHA
jgi:hypothetical protein